MRASLMLGLVLVAGCGGQPPAVPATALPLVTPRATPAPGGGSLAYPRGTVIRTGAIEVTIGPGGSFSPDLVYLRPGTTTVIINRDTVPHTFTGFGGRPTIPARSSPVEGPRTPGPTPGAGPFTIP